MSKQKDCQHEEEHIVTEGGRVAFTGVPKPCCWQCWKCWRIRPCEEHKSK